MKMEKTGWILTAFGGIALSILSLFLPVLSYTDRADHIYRFNIIDFMFDTHAFINTVFTEYRGTFMQTVSDGAALANTLILVVIGVSAIVLSFIGIISMSQQSTNRKSFLMAIAGLVGTAIPALVILLLVVILKGDFMGRISAGPYLFITPIAMLISCRAVTYKRKVSLEQLRAQEAAKAYISTPTDI